MRDVDTEETGYHYEPKYAVATITHADILKVADAGGLVPFLEKQVGSGRYFCEWIGPDCYVLDRQVVTIDNMKLKLREAAKKRGEAARQRRREMAQQKRELHRIRWVESWIRSILDHPGTWALHLNAVEVHELLMHFLLTRSRELHRLPEHQIWLILDHLLHRQAELAVRSLAWTYMLTGKKEGRAYGNSVGPSGPV